MQREYEQGFFARASTREELESRFGPLVPSRMAAIVKEKGDKVKVRLVHDLRRSGINSKITLSERVVLPRISDVLEDAGALLRLCAPGEVVRFLVLDFRDAFKQLRIAADESRFLSGAGLGGWFAYVRMLFGVGSGPLLWGRVAALACRATQALLSPSEARLQCYVDDPIITARGTEECILDNFSMVLLF